MSGWSVKEDVRQFIDRNLKPASQSVEVLSDEDGLFELMIEQVLRAIELSKQEHLREQEQIYSQFQSSNSRHLSFSAIPTVINYHSTTSKNLISDFIKEDEFEHFKRNAFNAIQTENVGKFAGYFEQFDFKRSRPRAETQPEIPKQQLPNGNSTKNQNISRNAVDSYKTIQ